VAVPYQVREVLPDGVIQTTANPPTITFTRGETFAHIDFGNAPASAARAAGPATATAAPTAMDVGTAQFIPLAATATAAPSVGGDVGALLANMVGTSTLFAGNTTPTLLGVNVGTPTTRTQSTTSTTPAPAPVAVSSTTSTTQPGAPLSDSVVSLADPLHV
jgi:hypothetical protein